MAVRNGARLTHRRRGSGGIAGYLSLSVAIIVAALLLKDRGVEVQAKQQAPRYVAQFDTVEIPVPSEPVSAGLKVNQIKFRTIAFPRHQVPDGALTTLDGLGEAIAITALPANLPLFRENLSNLALANNPVIERIPLGMRAMTIRVDATSAVEGWAGSGAVVDVLLIEKNRTSVVAENVKILSAERVVSPVEGAASPSVPSTVTLLVSQEQCLAINTAIPLGKIAFALRGGRDRDTWIRSVFTSANLKSSDPSSKENQINGYVSVKEQSRSRSFALNAGKWVETEVVPEGFMVAAEK